MLIVAGALLMVWLLRRAAQSRATLALEERLQFERLLADLSAGLIHIAASEIESALERGLQHVSAFLRVDRGTLDEFFRDTPGVRMSWTAPGIEPLPPVLDNVDKFPWTVESLQRGDIVRFSRVDELPKEATIDRASYLARGHALARVAPAAGRWARARRAVLRCRSRRTPLAR